MAACKSSNDGSGTGVHVAAASLPITCKLQNPPSGVTIAGAEYAVLGSGQSTSCVIAADGQSFAFPAAAGALTAGTTVMLEVRIAGPFDGSYTQWLVEDCDQQTKLVAVSSSIEKLGQTQVVVA